MRELHEDDPCSPTPATGPTPPINPRLLADILVAWAEGELSEGAVSEITGMDRFTLRGMKQDAIDRALAYAGPIMESNAEATITRTLDAWTLEKREAFFGLRPEWRSIYARGSRPSSTTGGPSSSTCP